LFFIHSGVSTISYLLSEVSSQALDILLCKSSFKKEYTSSSNALPSTAHCHKVSTAEAFSKLFHSKLSYEAFSFWSSNSLSTKFLLSSSIASSISC
jgi:hypothetical protein